MPEIASFRIKIAVNWEKIVLRIVQIVHSRYFGAICYQIFAAPRMLYFLAALASVSIKASAVEPHSGGVKNLLTVSSLKTWIGLATSIDTAVSTLNKGSTVLFKGKKNNL